MALSESECDQWHSAILEELATIKEAGTWELIEHTPTIQNVIGCQFVLQKKWGESGEVTYFKAHQVTGFQPTRGGGFLRDFCPHVSRTVHSHHARTSHTFAHGPFRDRD